MKNALPADILTNPVTCAKVDDNKWVSLHVPRFKKVRPAYKSYSVFLKRALQQVCKRLAPDAVVEARAKEIASFAEKILRKRGAYQDPKDPLPPDPLVRLTDLCGGRVVVQTAAEVRTICQLIERAFDIDRRNSEDVSQRLKPTEFGYRSVHYIVQVNPDKLKAAGIDIAVPRVLTGFAPKRIGIQAANRPLKAEIQVRTLLEHAAASLGHDTIYKTDLRVPNPIKRQHATLAAVLEGVDSGFGRLLASLNEFQSNYGAYRERDAVEKEIKRLQIVLAQDPKNISLAVRLARHALAIGWHERAESALRIFAHESHFGVQRMLGQTLAEMHWDQPKSAKYKKGCSLLEAACTHPPKDSETICLLAECIAREDDQRARELFHEAIQADSTEPLTLARYLEFEISHLANDHAVRLSTPMIQTAMGRCRNQIEAHANLPAAWSSLALYHLLLGEPFAALNALAHLGSLCQGHAGNNEDCGGAGRPCAAGRALNRFRETLRRLRCIREKISGFDWSERAVLLLLAARAADKDAFSALKNLASWNKKNPEEKRKPHFTKSDRVLILAGACLPEFQPEIEALRPHLLRACSTLSFKFICGGTTTGISGVAGDIAEASDGQIVGYGYLPKYPPRGSKEDENPRRYAERFSSSGTDFTPLDPLQGWTDIIASCVDPRRVKLLSYAGGEITHAESVLALALGARVAVIENVSLPKDRQFLDPAWQDQPNLVRLPMDAMTLRAFILVDDLPISAAEQRRLEKAARKAHEDYIASATPRDPSLKKWDDLDEVLKLSNYHQVAYWEKMLREHGLGIRPLMETDKSREPLKMIEMVGKDGINLLAEMEHGRWNVERLLRGWKYHSEPKDVARKLNPCLAPWPSITNVNGINYQDYDLDAIRGLPAKLREVGLELYKL